MRPENKATFTGGPPASQCLKLFLLVFPALLLLTVAACGGADPTPTSGQAATPAAATPAAATSVAATPVAATPVAATPVAATPAATAAGVSEQANLEIRATDAPPDDVSKILITVGSIEIHSAGRDGWVTVVQGPVEFDLVEIQGVEEVLGEAVLDPGRYDQVRLAVEQAEVTVDGNVVSARVPSGSLKIAGGFSLVAGETTILTLDFDAEKSVVVAGTRNVLIKPVIKLLTRKGNEALATAEEVGETEATEEGGEAEDANTPEPTAGVVDSKSAVTVAEHPELGSILVDGESFTLYMFTQDQPDTSSCTGGCATTWPPLLAPVVQPEPAGEGVNPDLIGVILREDGSSQVTYNGHALYSYIADRNPGDTRGQNLGGAWFVVSPGGEPITTSN